MNEWMNGLLWPAPSSQYFFPDLSFWPVSLQPQAHSLEQGYEILIPGQQYQDHLRTC